MKKQTKNTLRASLLLATGILLPMVFHFFAKAGPVFLPMHIPVLIGGFVLPPSYALILGATTPLLSAFITGMPILFPIGIIMSFELAIYAFCASLLFNKTRLNVLSVLIVSMIFGRLGIGLVVFFIANLFELKLNALIYLKTAIITGIPGIIIQLVLIPIIIKILKLNKI